MMFRRWLIAFSGGIALAAPMAAGAAATDAPAQQSQWVASWATALQPIPDLAAPPPLYRAPDVAGRTVRQIVYPTIAGRAIRVRVSNAYGKTPLVIGELRIGRSAGGAAVVADSSVALTFGGKSGVEVAPGQERESDPIAFDVARGKPYALSLYMGPRQTMTVWHRVANQINYVSSLGNHAVDAAPDAYRTRFTQSAWVAELAVDAQPAKAAAIAAIGDSITDGMRSSLNRNRRWPDALAARIEGVDGAAFGVLNLGISGNRLLSDSRCYGVALERRFERDVLARSGVKVAVVMIGINDINFAAMPARAGFDCDAPHTRVDAQSLIDGYRRLIAAAHARGVAMFGATLTPASLPQSRESIRRQVNEWIRTSGAFDDVMDFDAALRDPAKPSELQRRYNSGDDIHPNDAGYQAMADAVSLEPLMAAAGRH
ncbi:lipase [Burkholderia singularis]|uniref:Lipase n=1 Tax=Burkholderia singularis TaxID=1503053 RepID=A0A103E3J1_9BURK|nr:SGNH/GDSL hydrolase family protein [Burkholderia singularis]KVE27675.1 lipase [Burkholderia singularis]